MSVSELFEKIRAKRKVAVAPLLDQYFDIARALARGEDVDSDEVEVIVDQLGFDEHRLATDVETLSKRFAALARLVAGQQAQALLIAADHDLQKLQAEHQAFMDTWQPKAKAVHERRQQAEQITLFAIDAEHQLRQLCIDPRLIERQAQHDAQRKELHARHTTLTKNLSSGCGAVFGGFKRQLISLENQLQGAPHDAHPIGSSPRRELRGDIINLKREIEAYAPKVEVVQRELDDVNEQLRQLAIEQTEINRLKLIP